MKSVGKTLFNTLVGCIGVGVMFGVWDACKTYASFATSLASYDEGFKTGVEIGKKISKNEESKNEEEESD